MGVTMFLEMIWVEVTIPYFIPSQYRLLGLIHKLYQDLSRIPCQSLSLSQDINQSHFQILNPVHSHSPSLCMYKICDIY